MGFSDIISSVIGGGITGLAGAFITRLFDYKNKQLDITLIDKKYEYELQMKNADARILELEYLSRERIAVVEADSRIDVADAQAFQASMSMEPKLYHNPSKLTRAQNAWMVLIDGVRGLIRPGLTLYLCLITTFVYWEAGTIIKKNVLSPDQAFDIYSQISSTILYLTTTCVLFWFGSRAKQSKGK